jgi:hypothetical protein
MIPKTKKGFGRKLSITGDNFAFMTPVGGFSQTMVTE